MKTRVWQFDEAGGPEKLILRETEQRDPGYGEVRVRLHALSLNRADTMWLANTYIESPSYPSGIGYEVAGSVESLGPGVQGVQVGDTVSALPAFSISDYANFGETAILPVRSLLTPPSNFSAAESASFAFAYLTGYFALFELAQLKPYQTVLVTAGTSTTGLAAIPLIHKAGATVIATTRTSKKREALQKAGADYVIATEEENLLDRVNEITSGRGVDITYDCVAGALSESVVQSIKVRGHWIVYGFLEAPAQFPWWHVAIRSTKFDLFIIFAYTGNRTLKLVTNEEAFARAKQFIAAGLTDGSLPPIPVGRSFHGLESLPEAIRFMLSNEATGKIVVTL